MDIALKISLLFLVVLAFTKLVYMKPATKKKVVFFGDSITEFGMGSNGYVTLLKNLYHDHGMETYQVVGAGVSGNTVTDLRQRLEKSVLVKEPFATIIYIGINDVWHNPLSSLEKFSQQFEGDYRYIIQQLILHNSKVLLCTPTVIGEQQHGLNARDAELDLYASIIRGLAQEFKLPLVDLRKAFIDYYTEKNPTNLEAHVLTVDGVHLNKKGNLLVAATIWNELKDLH